MDIELFRNFCLQQPYATEDFPFDETTLVFRVKNKIFACISLDKPDLATLKCEPDYATELRSRFLAIEPAWHWNKKYWNQIWFNRDVDDRMFQSLIVHSYEEVVKKLPKNVQNELKINKLT